MNLIAQGKNKYCGMSNVAKATFWFFVCNMLQKCISLITTPIFTRLLSTDQYGIFNTYNSWVQIFTIVITFRLDYGIFNKGMTKYPEDRDAYTTTMQSLSSLLTMMLLGVYLVFHDWFNNMTGLSTFITVAMFFEIMFTSAISYWSVRQRYEFRYKAVVATTLGLVVCNAGLGVVGVLLSNHRGIGRIIANILVQCCFGICIYAYNIYKGKKLFVAEYVKFAILFNIPLMPHYFASYILDQFDRIMIMKLVDYSAVGIYSLAYSGGFVIKIVTSSLNNTLIPWLYHKLEEKDFDAIKDCINSLMGTVRTIFMLFMAFAPEVVLILGGRDYMEAVYVLPPVTASVFLISLYEFYANVEFYYNANKFTMYIAIVGAGLNVLLNYICITRWGYLMAAYTTLVCYIYFSVAHFIYMTRLTRKINGRGLFDVKSLIINLSIILPYTLLINFLYDYFILRIILIVLILLYMIIRRKKMLEFLKELK